MKKRIAVLTILTAALLLTACKAEETPVSGDTKDTASQVVSKEADEQTSLDGQEEPQAVPGDKSAEEETAGTRILNIYYSNEMADGLKMTTVEADRVTPELLLSSLTQYNIVTKDTKVRSARTEKIGDETVVFLDLSKEFGNYVSTIGTSGEYVIIGALTNTFLDAYEGDKLRLTVEGNFLESGHALYDWDLTRYPLTSYTVETRTYEKNKIHLEYPQLVNVKDSFTETEWNEILERYARKDLDYLDAEAEYTLTYEVATATEELLSIVYRIGGYETGAAHPYSYIETFNIDLNSGKEVRLADFIDTGRVVECLTSGNGYEIVDGGPDKESLQEYINTCPDMLTREYFDNFDLNFAAPDAYPVGYSYKKDDAVIICLEVNHALGDFVEIKMR